MSSGWVALPPVPTSGQHKNAAGTQWARTLVSLNCRLIDDASGGTTKQ